MGKLSRRQVLLGGGAIVGAGLVPAIPSTTATPAFSLVNSALAATNPTPENPIRLSANENPYGPSRVALQAIAKNLHLANRYADGPIEAELIDVVAKINNVPTDHMMVTTGSAEVLNVAGLLAGLRTGSVVCVDPTFQSLLRYAENAGMEIIRVPVNENLNADLPAMRRALRSDTAMVYIVNPNNPIPSIIEKNAMREFVLEMSQSRLVFVDEAYHEFVENPDYESMIGLIAEGHNNIIVSRTASKIHGLAGMRVGFGFAHPDLISEMKMRRTGDNNVIGMSAAVASYKDQEFQDFTRRKNRQSLAIVENMCEELGIRYAKSNTNFTFIQTGVENRIVQEKMLRHGILTGRDFPPMTNWARISMSTPEHMEYFVQAFRKEFA
ncbi:MAG: histidinol-phosphate transaminase [Woeseiaceae bacterium]|nr:histidinol-phosphate transaminase [Woeseiaceae bacterium]